GYVLNYRQISEIESLASESWEARSKGADIARQTDALVGALLCRIDYSIGLDSGIREVEAARVKCAIYGAAVDRGPKPGRIAVEIDVAKSQIRSPALRLPDSLHLPAAQHTVQQAVPVLTQEATTTER